MNEGTNKWLKLSLEVITLILPWCSIVEFITNPKKASQWCDALLNRYLIEFQIKVKTDLTI